MHQMKTRPKRVVRGLVDRVMGPYVERLSGEIRAQGHVEPSPPNASDEGVAPHQPGGVPSDFFHLVNHELRTVELERLPKGARRALSVGASGRWYFDWFERSVGPLDVHIGVEAFEPEPDDLPPYVRWIATTADRFDGVDDDDVDIVFAGQTSEHLWARELADFLLQSHRVLRSDGMLVLDSPNRLVTEHLQWSHGGHTVELSAGEIVELLTLAGFRTESVRGLWRCRFGDGACSWRTRLSDGATLVRRITDGPDDPDDCFVWWVVARLDHGAPTSSAPTHASTPSYRTSTGRPGCAAVCGRARTDGLDCRSGRLARATCLPFMLHEGRWRIGITLVEGRDRGSRGASDRDLLTG